MIAGRAVALRFAHLVTGKSNLKGNATMKNWKLDDFAKHYAETMARPSNAWGQHLSDIFGQSHYIMIAASKIFGSDETQDAFAKAIRKTGETQ